jgi:hypothetical protein
MRFLLVKALGMRAVSVALVSFRARRRYDIGEIAYP